MRWYYRKLEGRIVLMQARRREYAEQLEELQRICFPTLADEERFKADHYLKHMELFEDGQLSCPDGDSVVGASTTLRLNFDFEHVDHTFAEIIQGGWLTSHDPEGEWLYGADISVHPDYPRTGPCDSDVCSAAGDSVEVRAEGTGDRRNDSRLRAVKESMTVPEYYAGVAGRPHP